MWPRDSKDGDSMYVRRRLDCCQTISMEKKLRLILEIIDLPGEREASCVILLGTELEVLMGENAVWRFGALDSYKGIQLERS